MLLQKEAVHTAKPFTSSFLNFKHLWGADEGKLPALPVPFFAHVHRLPALN